MTITYKARLNPSPDAEWVQVGDAEESEVDVTNIASMLQYSDGGQTTLKVKRESSAENYRIRVFKYGSGHMESGLEGAVFGLYQNKLDGNGDPIPETDEEDNPVTDESGNPVYVKERVIRSQGAGAGLPVVFATGTVWMLDGLIQSELTGRSAEEIAQMTDEELIDHLYGDYDYDDAPAVRESLVLIAGYADVQLNQQLDGVYLEPGISYYLREETVPEGYARDTSIDYYAFSFGEIPQYVGGIWQYFNNDILKVRNSPEDGAFTLKKSLAGNYALSDAQKEALRFTIRKKVGSGWEDVEVEVPVLGADGVWQTDGEGAPLYANVTALTYDQIKDGISVTHIGPGIFRVVEFMTNGVTIPGSVLMTAAFTRDEIEEDLTEVTEGGEVRQYVQFEITQSDIDNGLEHVYAITNTYTQETVTLYAKKAWRNAENNPVVPAGASVVFGAYARTGDGYVAEPAAKISAGARPYQSVTLPKDGAAGDERWRAAFDDLPYADGTGTPYVYVLAETEGYPGFSPDYGAKEYLALGGADGLGGLAGQTAGSGQGSTGTSGSGQGLPGAGQATAGSGGMNVLVNREDVTEFSFYKVWRNASGVDLEWQKPITVTLNAYIEGAPGTDVLSDVTYTLAPNALPTGWSASQNAAGTKTTFTLEGLPAADEDGRPLVYYIEEAQPDGCAEPIIVTSSGGSVTDSDGKVRNSQGIINVPEDAVILPSTGGSGTWPLTVAGFVLILCAGAALVRCRLQAV